MKSNEDAREAIDSEIGVEQVVEWYKVLNEKYTKGRAFSAASDEDAAIMVKIHLQGKGINTVQCFEGKNMKNYRHIKTAEGVKGLSLRLPNEEKEENTLQLQDITQDQKLYADVAEIKKMCAGILKNRMSWNKSPTDVLDDFQRREQ